MKGKILLVEDSATSAAVVSKELDFLGYDYLVARDGKEAVQKAADYLPDLIVMDISLPKMDGLQATAQIRQNAATQAIPIIAATARGMPGEREKCLQAGCDDYLLKPFGHRELGASIDRLLMKRRSES